MNSFKQLMNKSRKLKMSDSDKSYLTRIMDIAEDMYKGDKNLTPEYMLNVAIETIVQQAENELRSQLDMISLTAIDNIRDKFPKKEVDTDEY